MSQTITASTIPETLVADKLIQNLDNEVNNNNLYCKVRFLGVPTNSKSSAAVGGSSTICIISTIASAAVLKGERKNNSDYLDYFKKFCCCSSTAGR